jgi:serine/threonine protein kinase
MIGEVVDGHEILRPLGAGGMGEVYLARGEGGSLRAFKVVRTDMHVDPAKAHQVAGRFRREALALGKLQHPGIVRILDAGHLPSGALYLGMEYVAGPDLQAAVGWDGPFPVADAMRVLAQLANALAYAHAAGVVHRDLKPSNVILEDGDPQRAKIIDFGLAKIAEDQGLTRLTEDKQALGSPLYWAPEQSASSDVGPAADIYSLGGIAYFLLSGEPVFKPRPAVAMVYAHNHIAPEPLAKRCPDVGLVAGLDRLLESCLAKQPHERPTGKQLVAELEQMLWNAPTSSTSKRAAQRLFTSTGQSNLADALTNQIRAVLLELAAVMDRSVEDIERIQHELSEQELDLAMLESDAESAADSEVVRKRDAVLAAVAQLKSGLADAFRGLYDAVTADRKSAHPDARPLFDELDSLVEQYRSL